MSNGHNNCNSENKRKFYLFGRSDTLGNPEKDKEAILKYAGENGLKFILGRTNFKNDEFNDEIGEYVGSDVLSALNKETC